MNKDSEKERKQTESNEEKVASFQIGDKLKEINIK